MSILSFVIYRGFDINTFIRAVSSKALDALIYDFTLGITFYISARQVMPEIPGAIRGTKELPEVLKL